MKTRLFSRFALGFLLLIMTSLFWPATTVLADYYGDLTVDPEQGEVGDQIDIEGDDFTATYTSGDTTYDSYVSLFFSDEEADIGDEINDEVENYEILRTWLWVDTSGDFDTSFYIPDELTDGDDDVDVGSGTYYVYATYSDEDYDIIAVAEFTVIDAEITLNTTFGATGTTVTVSGSEFNTNEGITVYYDGSEISISSGDTATDSDGEFSCAVIIPESPAGSHTIKIVDDEDSEASVTFTVTEFICLSTSSGNIGNTISVTGTGFAESESVTITFNNSSVASGTTNDDGTFLIKFKVPSLTATTYYVVALDGDNNSAQAAFNLTINTNLSQTTANIGDEISISGKGFLANATVSVLYGTNSEIIAQGSSDSHGAFSIAFTVPVSTHGSQSIIATDGVNRQELAVAVEQIAPAVPALLTPAVEEKARQPVSFDWDDVTDPSLPVTYTLQILLIEGATDTPVFEKTGLTTSEYTMTDAEKLSSPEGDSYYCWRVKASDGAGNESDWTTARLLDTGFSFDIPTWLTIVLSIVGAIVVFIGGFSLGRKTSYA